VPSSSIRSRRGPDRTGHATPPRAGAAPGGRLRRAARSRVPSRPPPPRRPVRPARGRARRSPPCARAGTTLEQGPGRRLVQPRRGRVERGVQHGVVALRQTAAGEFEAMLMRSGRSGVGRRSRCRTPSRSSPSPGSGSSRRRRGSRAGQTLRRRRCGRRRRPLAPGASEGRPGAGHRGGVRGEAALDGPVDLVGEGTRQPRHQASSSWTRSKAAT
jgi:hypothetical protein